MSLAGLHWRIKRRPGKPTIYYCYAWRNGPLILRGEGAKPKLTAEALERYQDAHRGRRKVTEDTIGTLCHEWRASPEWRALAASTRATWGYALTALEARFGKATLIAAQDPRFRRDVMAWRASMSDKPRSADVHMTVFRALLEWGRLNGRLTMNLADGIKPLWKGGNRESIIWEPAEVEALRPALSPRVRDAFDLARFTGFRRGDLVALPWDAVLEHAIVWRTSKSSGKRTVTVPIVPRLGELLAELRKVPRAPGVKTVLVNTRGRPWTAGGITAGFNRERDAAGFDKHLHDARGTFATELAPFTSDQQIAGIMGWSVSRIAEIRRLYVDQARTVIAIGEAIARK